MNRLTIILLGNLIVNLPVTIIILIVSYLLITYFDVTWNISLIIGVAIGWYFWGKLISIWVKFCLRKGASKEEVFKSGKLGLINFYRHKVFEID